MKKETKKAQAVRLQAEEAARMREEEARTRAALHWTEPAPPPDVMPPTGVFALSTGYTFNVHAQRVDVACSSSISHSVGRTDRTTTQEPKRLYSTRLLALQALRNAMEWRFAEQLAKIDKQIEDAA